MEIINHEKKEIIPLTHEENIFIINKKYVIYAKKNFVWIKMIKIIKERLKIIVIILENLEGLHIVYAI